MYYTYILQSEKDGRFYIGQTSDLFKRIERHNKGYERYSSKYIPWNLVWFKAVETRSSAFILEQKLKKFKSRKKLETFILENPCVPGSENIQICDLKNFREST